MRNVRTLIAGGIAAGAVLVAGVAFAGDLSWKAKPLVGANEVPPNTSTASARAQFELEGDHVNYKLKMINGIQDAFMAHIHMGTPGVNGPIVVWLLGTPPPDPSQAKDYRDHANVAQGSFTAADLVGPLAGMPLQALVNALNTGHAYVNIHTLAHPGGEIRAQVVANVDG